jgi:hypothetical protein
MVAVGAGAPQPVQKRVLDCSGVPQLVQTGVARAAAGTAAAIGLPQAVQNFDCPLTSLPQDEQTAMILLLPLYFVAAIFSTSCE